MGVFPVIVSVSCDSVELEAVVSVAALIEARVYRETLAKVLDLLYEAERRGWSLRQVIDLVGEWYSEVEVHEQSLYEESDPVYQRIVGKLREHSRESTQVSPKSRHPAQSVD